MNNVPNTIDVSIDADVRSILQSNGIFGAIRSAGEYTCWRTRTDGELQRVLIRIHDYGPKNPNGRYIVKARPAGATPSSAKRSHPRSSG